MNRRCTSEFCQTEAVRKASLNCPVATVLHDPRSEWPRLAGLSRVRTASHKISVDWKKYPLDQFLWTHCVIVASCEVENNGYHVKPSSTELINNNGNGWANQVLMATFKSFIGGENFCFVPRTRVIMADGTQKPIEDIVVGDEVLTHKGRTRRVLRTFRRDVAEDINYLTFDRSIGVTGCTKNHPFRKLAFEMPKVYVRKGSTLRNQERHKKDKAVAGLRQGEIPASEEWQAASSLSVGDFVLGVNPETRDEIDVSKAVLLGYYLSEGCLNRHKGKIKGVVLTFGTDEGILATHAIQCASIAFPQSRTTRNVVGNGSVLRVDIRGEGIGEWFLENGGEYSHQKRLSRMAMEWPRTSLLALFSGWASGDGSRHKKTKRVVGSTTSEKLAEQMFAIAERTGIRSSFWRETDASFVKRQKRYSVVSLPIAGEKRDFEVRAEHKSFNIVVSRSSLGLFSDFTPRWHDCSDFGKIRCNFANWQGIRVHKVSGVKESRYVGPVFNIEVEEDNSYVLGNGVAVHNCEHVQQKELSKGKIVDAALRPWQYVDSKGRGTANVYLVDILVATDRKHEELVRQIESGEMATLSMGTQALFVVCSKCGKVLSDSDANCEHIQNELLKTFVDKHGIEHVVAELCGRMVKKGGVWVGDPESNKFIEASWVAKPAFEGAVLSHFVLDPPKSALKVLARDTNKLQAAVDDIFRLRVADRSGMVVLRVAQAELLRRRREGMVSRVAVGFANRSKRQ